MLHHTTTHGALTARVASSWPCSTDHSLAVVSILPVATRVLWGLKVTQTTSAVWPRKVWKQLPVSALQSCAGLGGGEGRGGEGEEVGVGGPSNSPCRFYQMNQLLFYPCVSCEQSEFMREGDRERERERERERLGSSHP